MNIKETNIQFFFLWSLTITKINENFKKTNQFNNIPTYTTACFIWDLKLRKRKPGTKILLFPRH